MNRQFKRSPIVEPAEFVINSGTAGTEFCHWLSPESFQLLKVIGFRCEHILQPYD